MNQRSCHDMDLRARALAALEKAQQENADRLRQLQEQDLQHGVQRFRELLESVLGIKGAVGIKTRCGAGLAGDPDREPKPGDFEAML